MVRQICLVPNFGAELKLKRNRLRREENTQCRRVLRMMAAERNGDVSLILFFLEILQLL
jgi:hypothetical protein